MLTAKPHRGDMFVAGDMFVEKKIVQLQLAQAHVNSKAP